MVLLEIIREFRETIKEKKEEERARAQLVKMPFNFEALEFLVNKYGNKKITVKIEGGNTIEIEPFVKSAATQSFRAQFDAAHK